ncbi:ABC transporter ATP-binding protein, partial [Mesorhizobium sp. M7A.F.Ca.CA.001.13.2.1]
MGNITLKNVSKSFGATSIIPGLDLVIENGEFVVFVGPSGCGKSTLLRLIAGLEDTSGGSINIDGRDVTGEAPAKRKLAMVFQSYALYPHMTVAKNIGFPLKMAGEDKATIDKKVGDAARVLNLTNYLERRPGQLSGGQRQRVAIGRAIVRQPTAFLFDEPLSNLDAALRGTMRLEISELHHQLKTTMIYVTHDQVEAMTMADKIVVLNAGNIEQVGSPMELYKTPKNLFVASFIGSPKMNLIEGAPAAK